MKNWFRLSRLLPALGLVIVAAALLFIFQFLAEHPYAELEGALRRLSFAQVAGSALICVVAYGVLILYDYLACRYAEARVSFGKIAFTSFCAFALSNSIGLANLAGGSVRMRLYSAFGLPTLQILRIIAFATTTFWLGFLLLAGLTFTIFGLAVPDSVPLPLWLAHGVGLLFLGVIAAYLWFASRGRREFVVRGFTLDIPKPGEAFAQIVVAGLDWMLAALALYVLLPADSNLTFPFFLTVFMSAQIVALISHVPGGVGVLEAMIVFFVVPSHQASPEILASLFVYRLLYYLGPMVIAILSLLGYEAYLRRSSLRSVSSVTFNRVRPIVPAISGVLVFIAGGVLLFSGATPNHPDRLEVLDFLPLYVVELSHFAASCLGVVLLVLSLSLFNRTRAAWAVSVFVLIAGAFMSLIKGFDFEEATLLSLFALFIFVSKREFYRPARLFLDSWSRAWFAAIVVVVGASTWLGFFAYRHVEYNTALWWHFSMYENAPRFLRALAGIAITGLGLGLYRLLGTPRAPRLRPQVDVASLVPLVRAAGDTMANLALLGDKLIYKSADGGAFLMYATQGHSWIVLGDPVGDRDQFEDLIHGFRNLADRYGGDVIFYQVRADLIPIYIDLGMMFLKVGEEAHVSLANFSLEGKAMRNLRQGYGKTEKLGVQFRIVPASEWPSIASAVRAVSDAWLREKSVAEKGFSLGYFDDAYLRHFPTAVLEREGKIVAFANLWEGGGKEELSVDLMRYDPSEPASLMEHLMVDIMKWGREQGYRDFNLGMAPLSGLATSRMGSRWNRVGHFLFRSSEKLYNFKGLRQYKEKFRPEWEPRFLAYPSKLSLPVALKDLTVLISGGVKGVVTR